METLDKIIAQYSEPDYSILKPSLRWNDKFMDLHLSINKNKSFHLNILYNFMNYHAVQNLWYQESQYMGQYRFSFYQAVKKIIYYSGKDGPMGVGHPLHAKKKWDNLKNQIQNMYMCYQ